MKHGRVSTPRFSGASWLALRALRGAYKRVRVRIRVRPERARGVLLLTGEHDDLSGDYLALMLRNGHVELRFDCGSGAGILRSPEPVRLGHWNTISVYRHRWDAWLRLNNGKRVRGRSKTFADFVGRFRERVSTCGGDTDYIEGTALREWNGITEYSAKLEAQTALTTDVVLNNPQAFQTIYLCWSDCVQIIITHSIH
ncbi:hypothetical protein HW555_006675 [Spodoptera exigua]|uniref:Laminin G domain-containing protein n=1 Tax=Spodoptera exigua TaxID=7107 RepID=A0A835GG41_SPOEX|nr:hypothetical protein HW555_006675 [Spodoptera exigua]